MRITIDKAGRVVIPKSIRERYNIHPGTSLEAESEAEGVLLKVVEKQPSLIRKNGILIHHGGDKFNIDTAAFINKERELRNRNILGDVLDK